MAFSYDISTGVGQVRLLISDTSEEDPIFQDDELSYFLTRTTNNAHLAAALAFGAIVRSRGLLAKKVKREGYENEEQALKDLLQAVKDMRDEALTADGTVGIGEIELSDEHFESYRPEWHDTSPPSEIVV